MSPEASSAVIEKKERWQTSKSIGVYLNPNAKSSKLLLIQHADGWGVPSGRLEAGEFLLPALRREIFEETGIESRFIYFGNSGHSLLVTPDLEITYPNEKYTSSGTLYRAKYHGPKLPKEWIHSEKGKDRLIRQFSKRDVCSLVLSQIEGISVIRRPEINLHTCMFYLMNYSVDPELRELPKYINEFLVKALGQIPNLFYEKPLLDILSGKWLYAAPEIVGIQDSEAVKRAWGQRWGP